MSTNAELRDKLRPKGVTSSKCKSSCFLFEQCGGIQPEHPLFDDCFDLFCCHKKDCDNFCPYNSEFQSRLREIGGLGTKGLEPIIQTDVPIPIYIPMVHHASSRRDSLEAPVVALDTYQVFRLSGDTYGPIENDPISLRKRFGLAESTRIILRGTAKDPAIERYWSYRRKDSIPEKMLELGIDLVISPNYSHFLDVPRPDNLFNRKRQLLCLSEFAKAGITSIPHLSANTARDWQFWAKYLKLNSEVKFVAKEFQTGNKKRTEGEKTIRFMSLIQDQIGRKLHPIIIGGAQFVESVSGQFDNFTIIDSRPFMNAVHRHNFRLSDDNRQSWEGGYRLIGQKIDDMMNNNINGYSSWIESRVVIQQSGKN